MLSNINPTQTSAWQALLQHLETIKNYQIKDLFLQDKQRFSKFHLQLDDLVFDYSKNKITSETVRLLCDLATETQLSSGIKQMFTGDPINVTENRAVLHTALRNQSGPVLVDGEDVIPKVQAVLHQMKSFCTKVHQGVWRGYTGKSIEHVINIGIGGSDLGSYMVTEALKPYWKEGIHAHFVSNVDGVQLYEVLKKLDPERSLFIIASKTFTTQETMTNAQSARDWFLQNGGTTNDIKKHFVAVSTNQPEVEAFGIDPENMFVFWDWVGGRFSVSSAIGLSIALTVGFDRFHEMLEGMAAADNHFRNAEFSKNIPVMMGLLGIWYINFFGATSHAILPYDQYLHRFPAFLQQLDMESNGKSVDRNGNPISYHTGPILWGEPGTNGQHAFYQLIHQGTAIVPADFIGITQSQHPMGNHPELLYANFLAQTQALMNGRTEKEILTEDPDTPKQTLPFKVFQGNRPSNSIVIKKLTPYNLGMLIALYEHKIFVQGFIWNIYSFDQFGVELGKKLAQKIIPLLAEKTNDKSLDSSTFALLEIYNQWR